MTYDPHQFDYEADEIPRPPRDGGPAVPVLMIITFIAAFIGMAWVASLMFD